MAGGRQREFDREFALDQAMRVFWKKGFSGASLTDLTESMGINKPSMYAAFGNKEQLFIASTSHYIERYAKTHFVYLVGDSPLQERLLACVESLVRGQTCSDTPKGCYISLSISETEADTLPEEAAATINYAKDLSENYFKDFFAAEINAGHLPSHHNPTTLAHFVVTMIHGSASMARSGKTAEEIMAANRLAIAAVLSDAKP